MAESRGKPRLYEVLGVSAAASAPQIRAAYRQQVSELEAQRSSLSTSDFEERMQLLRIAYDTVIDPVSRAGHDEKLRADASAPAAGALTVAPDGDPRAASLGVRAEAMAMRADAMSMRADALSLHGGLESAERRAGSGAFADLLLVSKRVVRAIGLLGVIGLFAFALTRCATVGSSQNRLQLEQKVSEQTALQEYYQTHGVRPASIAEMELLEAERRRKESEGRQADTAQREREQAARRFEEESRRIGREVAANLQRSEDMARAQAERDRELEFRAEQLKLEAELARSEPDRRRLELQRKQILEKLKQP